MKFVVYGTGNSFVEVEAESQISAEEQLKQNHPSIASGEYVIVEKVEHAGSGIQSDG
jgi:hypothetical protein